MILTNLIKIKMNLSNKHLLLFVNLGRNLDTMELPCSYSQLSNFNYLNSNKKKIDLVEEYKN